MKRSIKRDSSANSKNKMETADFLNPNRERSVLFLRKLCYYVNQMREKEDAKNKILEKVDELRKQVNSKKTTKKEINSMIDSLEKDIDYAVQKGCTLIRKNNKVNPGYRSIYKRIDSIDADMKDYLIKFTNRLNKIEEIERNLKNARIKKSNSEKLKYLEGQVKRIEKLNTSDVNQINRIKKKIKELKEKLY